MARRTALRAVDLGSEPTGVFIVETLSSTALSIWRWARTNSYGVKASHCANDMSENLLVLHTSR